MNFPYAKVTDISRFPNYKRTLPWIRFGIFNPLSPKKIIYPLGLVDSGSDITFVTHEIGEQLGYDIASVEKGEVIGVVGGNIDVYFHKVGIIVENIKNNKDLYKFVDLIGFTYKDFPLSMPQQTAILGTMGFFNHLNVCFKFPAQITIAQ